MARFDDWLAVTDPRVFAESLAEEFRLSGQELRRASEALAPAFALGFQRAMGDGSAWADLSNAFQGMVPGFPTAAARTGGAKPGDLLTRAFFGSDALAGAVARQASLLAGIAPDTIEKLMPGLAMLTMQTVARSTLDAMSRNTPEGWARGDVGAATAEMMRRGANAVEALSRPSDAAPSRARPADPWTAAAAFSALPGAFAEALKATSSLMQPPFAEGPSGAGSRPGAPPKPSAAPSAGPPAGGNPMVPFAALFEAFARPAPPAASPPAPSAPAAPPPAAEGPAEGLAATGRALGEGYAREMAALFERYAGDRKGG